MADETIKFAAGPTGTGGNGISAPNPPEVEFGAFVSPVISGDTSHNTFKDHLQVVGCTSLPDENFFFDSSFIVPGAKDEFSGLHVLRQNLADPQTQALPPLTIFGHTDPVSNPYYNMQLSRRRAMSAYAVLIYDVEIWETLIRCPLGNDKWELDIINTMRTTLGKTPFADDNELHEMDDATRQALILDYMKWLNPTQLTTADFLCGGTGEDYKGDVQGCSEFNPQFVLSAKREKELSKEDRNSLNNINRRVIAYLFKPGTLLDPKRWPCPGTKLDLKKIGQNENGYFIQQTISACKKRFWYQGETRSNQHQTKDRNYSETFDTFCCRFYQGISRNSPCENATRLWVIQLLRGTPRTYRLPDIDETIDSRPILKNKRYVVKAGDAESAPVFRGRVDNMGYIRIPVFDDETTMELRLDVFGYTDAIPATDLTDDKLKELEKKYQRFNLHTGALRHIKTGAKDDGSDPSAENQRIAAKQRLYNLGYGPSDFDSWTEDDIDNEIKHFQRNHLLAQTGTLDDNTCLKMRLVHDPAMFI